MPSKKTKQKPMPEIERINKQLNEYKEQMAVLRDKLRDLLDECQDHEYCVSDVCESLENACDRTSELV